MKHTQILREFIRDCHDLLINGSNSEIDTASVYLEERRHLNHQTINTHNIGYCPKGFRIPSEIRSYGKDENEACDYSRYIQGRIVVPIFDEFGTAVGIGTRKPTTEKGHSWWNLSRPFQKGHHLFLLNLARSKIFNANKVYLVEGYMDALVLNQFGITNVVAIMGTTLSLRHVSLIARYCDNVCICFDVDMNRSGQKGTNKSVQVLNRFGFCNSISILDLPVGVDPDEFIIRNGKESFLERENILDRAKIREICSR